MRVLIFFHATKFLFANIIMILLLVVSFLGTAHAKYIDYNDADCLNKDRNYVCFEEVTKCVNANRDLNREECLGVIAASANDFSVCFNNDFIDTSNRTSGWCVSGYAMNTGNINICNDFYIHKKYDATVFSMDYSRCVGLVASYFDNLNLCSNSTHSLTDVGFKTCLYTFGVLTGRPSVCDQIKPGMVGGEYFNIRDHCFEQIAKNTSSIKTCFEIIRTEDKVECIISFLPRYDYDTVYELDFRKESSLDTSVCNNLEGEEKSICIFNSIPCSEIPEDYRTYNSSRGLCYARYSIVEGLNKHGCELITNKSVKEDCYVEFAYYGEADSKVCEVITNQEKRDNCYYIASQYNADDFTYTTCGKISNNTKRDDCFTESAYRSENKRESCLMINDVFKQRSCKIFSGAFKNYIFLTMIFSIAFLFGLFYFLVHILNIIRKNVVSKKFLFILGVLVGTAFFFLPPLNIPILGAYNLHIFIIYKTMCPPSGGGLCEDYGFLPFPSLAEILFYIITPIIYGLIALASRSLYISRRQRI